MGHQNAALIMHTDPKDPHGQDLYQIVEDLDLKEGQVLFSTTKLTLTQLSNMYNMVDCTINISDAEGFGLATLESLSCETPIIVNMTGGLQEQVRNDKGEWFGIGIEPTSKSIIGSQQVPWIYEDRINKQDFLDALEKMYSSSKEELEDMGKRGRKHIEENYDFKNYRETWVKELEQVHEKCGSWENRKNYKNWELFEL